MKDKEKISAYMVEGYVARLDEYEDDNIGFFTEPQHDNVYRYRNEFIGETNKIFRSFMGKKVRVTIKII